eukprot:scaffold14781_cov113-Isochrysis_galbana.AAC.5
MNRREHTKGRSQDKLLGLPIETLLTSGDSAGHPVPVPDDPSALTSLPHFISPSLFLIQAALAGGWFKSCVHYNSNSLRLGLENLGENVEPSYVRVHLDSLRLRADYG